MCNIKYLPNIEFFKNISIFSKIDTKYIADNFVAQAKIKRCKKGENIFLHGDIATKFYIVKSGWVKLFRNSLDGKEVIDALCSKGSVFDEITLSEENNIHNSTCQSLEESFLIEMPIKIIKKALRDNHSLTLDLLTYISNKIGKSNKRIEHFCSMNAQQKIGCFLLQFCNKKHERKTKFKIEIPLNKGVTATYLGMNSETFSRSLAKLEEIGIKREDKYIVINDIALVENYVCSACSELRGSKFCFS